MENEDFEFCISVCEELKERLIVLSGNLSLAVKLLRRDEEIEKEYNAHAIAIDNDDVVESLHDLQNMGFTLQCGSEWVEHLKREKN